jgi:hypothetical protein
MKSFLKISFADTRGEVWELKIGCHAAMEHTNEETPVRGETPFSSNYLNWETRNPSGLQVEKGKKRGHYVEASEGGLEKKQTNLAPISHQWLR